MVYQVLIPTPTCVTTSFFTSKTAKIGQKVTIFFSLKGEEIELDFDIFGSNDG